MSGSVVGPLLAKELISREFPTIVLAIGDESTKLFTNNTLNTLKSYEYIARTQLKAPIPLAYFFNRESIKRKEVDNYVINLIQDLRVLFSNQHHGLDSQDLFHWLRYDKVTDYDPCLALMTIVTSDDEAAKSKKEYGTPITVATIGREGANMDYPITVDYHTEGTIVTDIDKDFYNVPIHYVIYNGFIDKVANDLDKRLKEIKQEQESTVTRASIVSDKDKIEDSGLVL